MGPHVGAPWPPGPGAAPDPAARPGRTSPTGPAVATAPTPAPPPLEIRRARADAQASGWTTELHLHVPHAPLGAVLVELGRAAGVTITVHPSVAHRPIATHVESATAEVVLRQLSDAVGARVVRAEDRVLVISTELLEQRQHRRRVASVEVEPIETRLYRIGDAHRARELATVYCHLQAGPRGSAATVGDELVVADVPSRLATLERMVVELAGPSATVLSTPAPPSGPPPAGSAGSAPPAPPPAGP